MKDTVASRYFTSKVPGVLAGLLVIAGIMMLIIGPSLVGSGCGILGCESGIFMLTIFQILPALLGLLASLYYNKPGKYSYLRYGISQIFLGLCLGLLPAAWIISTEK